MSDKEKDCGFGFSTVLKFVGLAAAGSVVAGAAIRAGSDLYDYVSEKVSDLLDGDDD